MKWQPISEYNHLVHIKNVLFGIYTFDKKDFFFMDLEYDTISKTFSDPITGRMTYPDYFMIVEGPDADSKE